MIVVENGGLVVKMAENGFWGLEMLKKVKWGSWGSKMAVVELRYDSETLNKQSR